MLQSQPDPISSEFPKQLDIAQVCVYGLAILSGCIFMFLPFVNLLHSSPWQRWMGTIHGVSALLACLVTSYAGHLAFPLLRGAAKSLPHIRTLSFWSTCLSFLAIATGNWAYMRYRADAEFGGACAWLKAHTPLVHYVYAQYHEFSDLFMLPLGAACSWILWQYGDSILDKKNRPILSATCIALMALMFFGLSGFVSGMAIAKVHAL